MLEIISGGQTGADRAALDAALHIGVPCGGWCPQDRKAEDGVIPARYPVKELPDAGYRQRTLRNVQDSDGTVIFTFGALTGGSAATAGFCRKERKHCLVIDARQTQALEAAAKVQAFIEKHNPQILNVAGPRASGDPRVYDYAYNVMTLVLRSILNS